MPLGSEGASTVRCYMVRKREDRVGKKAKAVAVKGSSKRGSAARGKVDPVLSIGHPGAQVVTSPVTADGADVDSDATELYSQFRASLLRQSSPVVTEMLDWPKYDLRGRDERGVPSQYFCMVPTKTNSRFCSVLF